MPGAHTEIQPSQTKIVATIDRQATGKRSCGADPRGVDVFRINAALGIAPRRTPVGGLPGGLEAVGWPVAVGRRPAPRCGSRSSPVASWLSPPATVSLRHGDQPGKPGTATTYELIDELAAGDRIMLADGTVSLVVEQVGADEAVTGRARSAAARRESRASSNAPALGEADATTPAGRPAAGFSG